MSYFNSIIHKKEKEEKKDTKTLNKQTLQRREMHKHSIEFFPLFQLFGGTTVLWIYCRLHSSCVKMLLSAMRYNYLHSFYISSVRASCVALMQPNIAKYWIAYFPIHNKKSYIFLHFCLFGNASTQCIQWIIASNVLFNNVNYAF